MGLDPSRSCMLVARFLGDAGQVLNEGKARTSQKKNRCLEIALSCSITDPSRNLMYYRSVNCFWVSSVSLFLGNHIFHPRAIAFHLMLCTISNVVY